jgi:Holliday junction resolvase RusA-like endonuclease
MAAPRMSKQDRWAKRPVVQRYRDYGVQVRRLIRDLPSPLRVVFWLPMPPSWSRPKRERHAGQPHEGKPDLDNLLKALLDAWTYGYARGDAHFWCVLAAKRWTSGSGAIDVEPLIVDMGAEPGQDCSTTPGRKPERTPGS